MEKNVPRSTIIERLRAERSEAVSKKEEILKKAIFAELDDAIEASTKNLLAGIEVALSAEKHNNPESASVSIKLTVDKLGADKSHKLIDRKIIDIEKYITSLPEKSISDLIVEYISSNSLAEVCIGYLRRYVKYPKFLAELQEQGLSPKEGAISIPGYVYVPMLLVTANLKPEEEQTLALEP